MTEKVDPKELAAAEADFEASVSKLERVLDGEDLSEDEQAEEAERVFRPQPPFAEGAVVYERSHPGI